MRGVWTTVLFAMLMVQTLAIASGVVPPHSGDVHHEHVHQHHAIGELSVPSDDAAERQDDGDLQILPDHCHGNHCHSAHPLLAPHLLELPRPRSGPLFARYDAQFSPAYVDRILRPPIA